MQSLRSIYKHERPQFLSILKAFKEGPHTISDKHTIIIFKDFIPPVPRPIRSWTAKMALKEWGNVELLNLHSSRRWDYDMGKSHIIKYTTTIIKVPMPCNTFTIMRNGWNITKYNFVVCDHRKEELHFRTNVKEVKNLINILGKKPIDLPVMMGMNMCKKNQRIFEQRLMEA